ncbi:polysaccharide biosynthesis C-terminal domain-containing protein [Candidatus Stoquefichus massiliensis]|uniref:oligosaccharide flippase family protein n=1 Tax=Candidatus Stoquefichus massiliensis TaxID=1470350 RepID=UPI0028FCA5A7|nr:polysaccharide biosynthesis C-terminal domain-containing protein [Candidatus Stoquefichus massiliensis]
MYIYISFFSVLSTGIANIFYGVYANKYLKFKFHFKIIVLKKHIKPILLIFSSTIASTIYVNSDISILGWIIGDYSVGIYSTSVKIYTIVKQVMLAVISVTIPRLTAYTETAKFKSLFNQVFNMLFTILFPAAIGLYCISENIVLIIAGEAYLEAVLPLQILSIALIFALLACIFGTGVLIPYRREDIFLYATIISAILNILLNLLLIPLYKQNAAALTTLIAEIVVFLICFIKSKEYLKSLNYSIIKPVFFGGLGIYLLCNIIKLFKFGFILETFLCILLSAIVYIFIELILKNEIIFDIYKKGIHILKRN